MTGGMTSAPELATCSPAVAGAAGEQGGPDVCLVTMPYASPTRPSMALGLLKAILAEGGITASVAYANLWFAESVGLRRYSLCASNMPIVFLAGEWTFAGSDRKRGASKWRCPTGECKPASVWVKADRLHPLIPRETKRWKGLYRKRASVEREFGRLKNDWGLKPLRVRGLERVRLHADLTVLTKLACTLSRARAMSHPPPLRV